MPVANSVCSPLRSQQSSNLTGECIQRRTPDCPWHAFLRISLCTQHKQISTRSWPTTSDSRVISVILSSNANANCHWPAFSQAVIAALKPQAQTCKRVLCERRMKQKNHSKACHQCKGYQRVLRKSVCNQAIFNCIILSLSFFNCIYPTCRQHTDLVWKQLTHLNAGQNLSLTPKKVYSESVG